MRPRDRDCVCRRQDPRSHVYPAGAFPPSGTVAAPAPGTFSLSGTMAVPAPGAFSPFGTAGHCACPQRPQIYGLSLPNTPRMSLELSYQGGNVTGVGSNMFSKKAQNAGLPFCTPRLACAVS